MESLGLQSIPMIDRDNNESKSKLFISLKMRGRLFFRGKNSDKNQVYILDTYKLIWRSVTTGCASFFIKKSRYGNQSIAQYGRNKVVTHAEKKK